MKRVSKGRWRRIGGDWGDELVRGGARITQDESPSKVKALVSRRARAGGLRSRTRARGISDANWTGDDEMIMWL